MILYRPLFALALIGFASSTQAQYFETAQVNPFNYTDVGTSARPIVTDLDQDGDLDLLVGELNGDLHFFTNISSNLTPDFENTGVNLLGVSRVNFSFEPALADLDNDGDDDLLAGTFSGNFILFERTDTFSFDSTGSNLFGLTSTDGSNSTPTFNDIDNDGDFDIFSGDSTGTIYFYENIGSAASPAFGVPQMNPFGLTNEGTYSSADFADFDSDGDFDCMVGNSSGGHFYFENVGTAGVPQFDPVQLNPFNLADAGQFSNPVFTDIDADGDLDLFVGNSFGNLLFYEQTEAPGSILGPGISTICMNTILDSAFIVLENMDSANVQFDFFTDDADLLPASNLSISGTYPVYLLTVEPAQDEAGFTFIDILVTDGNDSLTWTFSLTVWYAPEIVTEPEDVEICEGANALFEVETIAAGFAFQWFVDGTPIVGAEGTQLFIPAAGLGDAGDYTVEIYGDCGPTVVSFPVELYVEAYPEIIEHPASATVTVGTDTGLFVVTAQSSPDFLWFFDGTPISSATTPMLTLNNVTEDDEGWYYCEITSDLGCLVSSDSAFISVEPPVVNSVHIIEAARVQISPNPTKGEVLLVFDRSQSLTDFRIYDSHGHLQLIKTTEVRGELRMDVSGKPSGLYFLQGTFSDGTGFSQPIINLR